MCSVVQAGYISFSMGGEDQYGDPTQVLATQGPSKGAPVTSVLSF